MFYLINNIILLGTYMYFYNKFFYDYIETNFTKAIMLWFYTLFLFYVIDYKFILKSLFIYGMILLNYTSMNIYNDNKNVNILKKQLIKYLVYTKPLLSRCNIVYDYLYNICYNDFLLINNKINNIDNLTEETQHLIMKKLQEKIKDVNDELNAISNLKEEIKENEQLMENTDNILKNLNKDLEHINIEELLQGSNINEMFNTIQNALLNNKELQKIEEETINDYLIEN